MDPDAPWQGSQNAAARKAVETTDAAWPTMVRRSLMAEEAKSFRSSCLARKRSEKAKGWAGASPRAPATPSRPSAPLRLARVGSSTTRLHLSRRKGLRTEDLGRGA